MNNTPDTPDPFEDRLKQALDQQADDLDELTLARLKAARLQAVDAAEAATSSGWPGRVMVMTRHPLGVMAASLGVAAIGAALWWQTAIWRAPAEPLLEDLALLERQENLEFFEELEFYRWLDEQQKLG